MPSGGSKHNYTAFAEDRTLAQTQDIAQPCREAFEHTPELSQPEVIGVLEYKSRETEHTPQHIIDVQEHTLPSDLQDPLQGLGYIPLIA